LIERDARSCLKYSAAFSSFEDDPETAAQLADFLGDERLTGV